MATLRQAIERQREAGALPKGTSRGLRALNQQYAPQPAGSLRGLLARMDVSEKKPWAVILCRLQGEPVDPAREDPVAAFYREIFAPGTEGLVEFWRDASLGAIDIRGTRVFNWVTVEVPRSQAGGSPITVPTGPGRSGLVDAAIRAVRDAGGDAETGFHSQIAIYVENWSKDGVDQSDDFAAWGPFWLDGSADSRGKVTLTPPHVGDVTAHEMGHGFGLQHDVSADFQTHYADPCCIMSQAPLFSSPRWNVNFGAPLCLAHLDQRRWMYRHRLFHDDGGWVNLGEGISLPLAPLTEPGQRANLGIKLTNPDAGWDYYLEYVRPTGWYRGLAEATVFVRRIGPGKDVGPTPSILGSIVVPRDQTGSASFLEPSLNVLFEVARFDPDGHIVRVTATRV